MCHQPGGPGSETHVFLKARQKTKFWTTFEFLTGVSQDDYRLKAPVVENFCISTGKESSTKNLKQSGEYTNTKRDDGVDPIPVF